MPKRLVARFKASLPAYLLLLPSLVFLALFTYGAMGRVLIDALYQRATPKAPVRFVGLDNIAAVLADPPSPARSSTISSMRSARRSRASASRSCSR